MIVHKFTESVSNIMKNSNLDEEHKLAAISAMLGKKMSGLLSEIIMVRGMIEHSGLEREKREDIVEVFDEFIYELRQHEEKVVHVQELICDKIGDYHMESKKRY